MLPWDADELTLDETRFAGVARLFPLPDLVMFPHVMQPLHIFEQRYREMLNDALDGDGLIAMSVLAPGWEANYEGRPATLPQVCLGKVVTHQRLQDGRYNIMLLGSRRARILCELPANRSFRQAEVELLYDTIDEGCEARAMELQTELCGRFQRALHLPNELTAPSAVHELLASDLPLGVLTDLVSFALPLSASLKRRLLSECDILRRAELLLTALGPALKPKKNDAAPAYAFADYGPRFSDN
jgi:Lon protease-like protein